MRPALAALLCFAAGAACAQTAPSTLSDAAVDNEVPCGAAVDKERDPDLLYAAAAVAELTEQDSGGPAGGYGEVPLDVVLRDAARRQGPRARSRRRRQVSDQEYRAPSLAPGARVPVLGSEFRSDACWVSAGGGEEASPLCADEER